MNLHHRYTGARVAPFAPFHAYYPQAPQGFCRSCGHPSGQCGCGCRTCRKEAKELLVRPGDSAEADQTAFSSLSSTFLKTTTRESVTAIRGAAATSGIRTAFIGGGCCVHISVEYTPALPTADSSVLIVVQDSQRTVMAWERSEKAGTPYKVNENIITTNPGANVWVIVNNMVAQIRWCECFSC